MRSRESWREAPPVSAAWFLELPASCSASQPWRHSPSLMSPESSSPQQALHGLSVEDFSCIKLYCAIVNVSLLLLYHSCILFLKSSCTGSSPREGRKAGSLIIKPCPGGALWCECPNGTVTCDEIDDYPTAITVDEQVARYRVTHIQPPHDRLALWISSRPGYSGSQSRKTTCCLEERHRSNPAFPRV